MNNTVLLLVRYYTFTIVLFPYSQILVKIAWLILISKGEKLTKFNIYVCRLDQNLLDAKIWHNEKVHILFKASNKYSSLKKIESV